MDTLEMHRTLTEAGVPPGQADAFIKVLRGGVATKQDLEVLEARLGSRVDQVEMRLSARVDLLAARIDNVETIVKLTLGGVVHSVLAPLIVRLVLG